MSPSAESQIATHLDPGERLLWSGQPRGGVRLRGQDVFLIPFSLLWGGFAIFWEVMATWSVSKSHQPVAYFFPLFGLPFVAIGLYIIFGRFYVDALQRERTFYGVTNDRIIILSGLFSRQSKSLQLRTLTDVSLTERSDGSGTITFGPVSWLGANLWGNAWPNFHRNVPPAFDLIDNAKQVYNIIRNAQRST